MFWTVIISNELVCTWKMTDGGIGINSSAYTDFLKINLQNTLVFKPKVVFIRENDRLMKWPVCLLDLNSINNRWSIVKRRLYVVRKL